MKIAVFYYADMLMLTVYSLKFLNVRAAEAIFVETKLREGLKKKLKKSWKIPY